MIRAINDIVIVKRDGYNGVIYVKDQKMSFGTILCVGPGRWGDDIQETVRTGKIKQKFLYTSPELTEGARVYFDESLGKDFEYEGQTYVMIRESHIAGILEDEAPIQERGYKRLLHSIKSAFIRILRRIARCIQSP